MCPECRQILTCWRTASPVLAHAFSESAFPFARETRALETKGYILIKPKHSSWNFLYWKNTSFDLYLLVLVFGTKKIDPFQANCPIWMIKSYVSWCTNQQIIFLLSLKSPRKHLLKDSLPASGFVHHPLCQWVVLRNLRKWKTLILPAGGSTTPTPNFLQPLAVVPRVCRVSLSVSHSD